MATALITGASGGIGLELARLFAQEGVDLILVARSTDKLEALQQAFQEQYLIQVTIISKDLSLETAPVELYQTIQTRGITVDYLINNAGFGDYGRFTETDWTKELRVIHLNMVALTFLTKRFLQEMVSRGEGRIMNVASTAAFQPGPLMAVYFATKAYVLSFSEAVANEARGTGVTVTTLCPGPTATGFIQASGAENSGLFSNNRLPAPDRVARFGYKAMMRGKTVAVHGFMNKILVQAVRITPRFLARQVLRQKAEQKG